MRPNAYFMMLLSVLLVGCGPSENSELRTYINSIKARPPGPIPPIPEFTLLPPFVYPENQHRRSPFKPIIREQVNTAAPNLHRAKEVLESYPLDALKFVGILKENYTTWGLILAPDKVVNKVRIGNYVGKNFGRIIGINDKELKIEESIQVNGKWEKKLISVPLNSPTEANQGTKP